MEHLQIKNLVMQPFDKDGVMEFTLSDPDDPENPEKDRTTYLKRKQAIKLVKYLQLQLDNIE